MKIAHISTCDFGGAGSATLLLHQYCKEIGYDSTLYTKVATNPSSTRVKYRFSVVCTIIRKLFSGLSRPFIDKKYLFYGLFDQKSELPDRIWLERLSDKDIIFVYWIDTFTTLTQLARVLEKLPSKKLYVVNFDMAHMTGGCHYSFGCSRFETGCTGCPNAALPVFKHFIEHQHFEKTVAIASLKAESLSFTPFVLKQASISAVGFLKNRLFNLPISTVDFRPLDDAKHNNVIFVGAYSPEDKRKGFELLCRILLLLNSKLKDGNSLINQKITLLFPSGTTLPEFLIRDFHVEYYKYATNNEELNAVYNKASLFLSTTLDDSGPVTVLQAMLAGIPVISHDLGYASDLIINGENGYLVNHCDVDSFAESILRVIDQWNVDLKMRSKNHERTCNCLSAFPQFSKYLVQDI